MCVNVELKLKLTISFYSLKNHSKTSQTVREKKEKERKREDKEKD